MEQVTRAWFDEVLVPTYSPAQFVPVRGLASRLWDQSGREYIDFAGGIAVNALGHCHPALVETLIEQGQKLWHVSNWMTNEPVLRLARKLVDATFADRAFFCNSGAEANEAAIKLARKWGGHGRYQVVSAYGSFHGRTLATLHATGQPAKWEGFQPLPEGFRHVAWDDLDALDAAIDHTVAAVLLEPVQGEGGVNPASVEYLQGVRRICSERGVLMMVDEVQTGLGRTGRWFGHQAAGIVPDVVTMAKALGNGVPVGACWAPAGIAGAFEPGDHATTFGGQPLAMAAARAVLTVMEAEDVPSRAARAGERIQELARAVPGIASTRGAGLLLGLALDEGIDARAVATACLDAGLVVNAVTPTTLRLAPSLLVTDDEIDAALDIIRRALA